MRLVEEGKCEERLEHPLMKMTKSKPQTPSNTLDCEINRHAFGVACTNVRARGAGDKLNIRGLGV